LVGTPDITIRDDCGVCGVRAREPRGCGVRTREPRRIRGPHPERAAPAGRRRARETAARSPRTNPASGGCRGVPCATGPPGRRSHKYRAYSNNMQEAAEVVANLIPGVSAVEASCDLIAKQWWEVYREVLGQPYDWDTLPPRHREAVALACRAIVQSLRAGGKEAGERTKAAGPAVRCPSL